MQVKRRKNTVSIVRGNEKKYLRKSGMFELAKTRTAGLVRAHVIANSGLRTMARDCYLQGIRDVAESLDHDEEHALEIMDAEQ